ncbi:unnamed protein product, partial [Soboliphyme baturini]|uniref:Pyr_redox_2 domain-containing protein n=1 Tax=Soboliphyme baturini TaxID=241478 RepID=A0A183IXP7_9BILA
MSLFSRGECNNRVGEIMESFSVAEKPASSVFGKDPTVEVATVFCTALDSRKKMISNNPRVVGIRDTESVQSFQRHLADARRMVVVGNGGIATEIIAETNNVEVVWAIKHKSIAAAFLDSGAAQFLLPRLNAAEPPTEAFKKRFKHVHEASRRNAGEECFGSALGPDWTEDLLISGACQDKKVYIEYQCAVDEILTPEEFRQRHLSLSDLPDSFSCQTDWQVYVVLTNHQVIGCDLVVSATGVHPNVDLWLTPENQFKLGSDGGLLVSDQMETSIEDVYAAGDACTAGWTWSPHWLQMRLWTQARQMGAYAGICMASNLRHERAVLDICFEIFTHVTTFFAFKVVLLGKFNGQGLRPDHETFVRITP